MTSLNERLTGTFELFSVFPLALPVTVSIRKDPDRSDEQALRSAVSSGECQPEGALPIRWERTTSKDLHPDYFVADTALLEASLPFRTFSTFFPPDPSSDGYGR